MHHSIWMYHHPEGLIDQLATGTLHLEQKSGRHHVGLLALIDVNGNIKGIHIYIYRYIYISIYIYMDIYIYRIYMYIYIGYIYIWGYKYMGMYIYIWI